MPPKKHRAASWRRIARITDATAAVTQKTVRISGLWGGPDRSGSGGRLSGSSRSRAPALAEPLCRPARSCLRLGGRRHVARGAACAGKRASNRICASGDCRLRTRPLTAATVPLPTVHDLQNSSTHPRRSRHQRGDRAGVATDRRRDGQRRLTLRGDNPIFRQSGRAHALSLADDLLDSGVNRLPNRSGSPRALKGLDSVAECRVYTNSRGCPPGP